MSIQDTGDSGSTASGEQSAGAGQSTAGWPLVRDCNGTALAEALFFWLVAHFRHPGPMWEHAAPWALIPVLCAVPGLVFGRRLRLLAAARGALLGGVVLVMGIGVLVLFDRMLSD
jgi:hypothetical protein